MEKNLICLSVLCSELHTKMPPQPFPTLSSPRERGLSPPWVARPRTSVKTPFNMIIAMICSHICLWGL